MKPLLASVVFCLAGPSIAQTPVVTEFPPEATRMTADGLREKLSGNVFSVKLANGGSWRLEYKSSGYVFVNTSDNFSASGTWKTENGKLCGEGRKLPTGCNEVRELGGQLYLKRDSGEIIVFNKQ